jgi:CotS family spore coat protein
MHNTKNQFDTIFLSNVDYYIDEIKKSIDILEKSPYYKICSEEDKIVLCHHDLAHHNIIIKDNEAYFIDFDYSIIDIKVHDLCNFINKVIKNFAFDEEKAEQIINCYSSVNNIDSRELKVLYGMLTFPDDFYSISKDYYTRLKQWDKEVFIGRLIKKCEYKEFRKEFLKSFYEFINHLI